MASVLNAPHFQDEAAAYAKIESLVWPNGAVCPHCQSTDRMKLMLGNATRPGLYKCYACRKQSRVTVGTVFESSHIKLHVWLQAAYLMCSSKKGISSNQLALVLGLTVKSAWFMSRRLRGAMTAGTLPPKGGEGETVEIDETFIGNKEGEPVHRGFAHKQAVLTLVKRGGTARSFHVDSTKASDLLPIIKANVLPGTGGICRCSLGTSLASNLVALFLLAATSQAATLNTLYHFTNKADGGDPSAGVIADASGTLYGQTYRGGSVACTTNNGAKKGCGTVYSFSRATGLKTIVTFTGPNGAHGVTGLALIGKTLYGATQSGGDSDDGVVFSVNVDGSDFTVLHQFSGPDGSEPTANLVAGSGNVIYGVTYSGGSTGVGVLFSITPAGVFTVVHNFGMSTGASPNALIAASNGTLVGSVNAIPTALNYGSVFTYVPATETFTTVFSEPTTQQSGYSPIVGGVGPGPAIYAVDAKEIFSLTQAAGYVPLGALNYYSAVDNAPSGPLYTPGGTIVGVSGGGVYNPYYGEIYSLRNGAFFVLHEFTGLSDGAVPVAQPLRTVSGDLIGTTTEYGYCENCGTIWELSP
jgi:uncharacterized repeat protein (TIGR03803 family)